MRVLDSHLHLWDPRELDYTWLSGRLDRTFGPDEYRAAADDAGAAERSAIFVQAECVPTQSVAEVEWVARVGVAAGVCGIVARVALEETDATARLAAVRALPLVVGVRRLMQDDAAALVDSPAFLAGARSVADAGLAFDACVRAHEVPQVTRLADAVPGLAIVLDHLGKPRVSGAPDPQWRADLRALAERPQVVCKLSGLPAEATTASARDRADDADGWTPAMLMPFLDEALTAFGPQRLLFGGDWPVSWPYARWEGLVRAWADTAAPSHVDDIMYGNAARVYGL